jgi:hypothetical protein
MEIENNNGLKTDGPRTYRLVRHRWIRRFFFFFFFSFSSYCVRPLCGHGIYLYKSCSPPPGRDQLMRLPYRLLPVLDPRLFVLNVLETKDVDLTRETRLTRKTSRTEEAEILKTRLRGFEATGESMGQKQKAWGKSMGCGESLSQAARRVSRPLLSRKRNNR